MWSFFAKIILRYRLWFLCTLLALTLFFGYFASKIELSYEFAKILPSDDKTEIAYGEFIKTFGEDGNVMVIGYESKNLFELKTFNSWQTLASEIKNIKGIQDVVSIGKLYSLHINDSLQKFEYSPILKEQAKTQQELDSIRNIILSYPFYKGFIYNDSLSATLMAVTFNKKELYSKSRLDIVKQIRELGDAFASNNGIEIHYSGLPYIRTEYMRTVSGEMSLFMVLAVLVTIITLWLFFRSFNAVFYSLIVCIIGVIWSIGILNLFDYKITILTSLIPPLIIIIGLPNCIFLINKYQEELLKHGNKMLALARTVERVGLSNFLANFTTSIGFFVFYFTKSSLLVEFGIVAGINVLLTNIVALVFIPIVYSYLPAPPLKATKHLENKHIKKIMQQVDFLVHNRRKSIYITLAVLTAVGFWGMTLIKPVGYMVDDLPKDNPIYEHLRFFEKHFKGVIPFEISIDTKKENGVFADNGKVMYKIKALEKVFAKYDEFSRPLSAANALKFAYQAYKEGNPKYYILPGATELNKLKEYNPENSTGNRFKAFVDSTKQKTRVSLQVADVGSLRMREIVNEIKPKVDSIFNPAEYNVEITGHSMRFLKGNDYLLKHLFVSLAIEVFVILLIGIVLFRSIPIIVLSKIPALIPLIITAGIMGLFAIHLKPSTILVFSIAFGISSDGTIYILAEYRNQLRRNKVRNISGAISNAIKETGTSMLYTNIILLLGFSIFAVSSFGGTVALGILISVTLMISLITNLLLLPSILLSLGKMLDAKAFIKEPLVVVFDEEEDIDLSKLGIKKTET